MTHASLPPLRNHYWALRHGRSEANEQAVINSDPASGRAGWRLTDAGADEVRESVQECPGLDKQTLIYSSDFLRTRQSAEVARELIGAAPVVEDARLRERGFGQYERGPNGIYREIWHRDAADTSQHHNDVEPVDSVLERTTDLVRELETKYDGRTILLVSHGDTLQILQTAFLELSPGEHPTGMFQTGELRELTQA